MKIDIGDRVKCNPEVPEYCSEKDGQIGIVASIWESSDDWGTATNIKVQFDDGIFLLLYPHEVEVIQ